MPSNISFIIPAYNEEKYISDCIYSIIKYTPSHYLYDISVIDNGSYDNTVKIANSLKVKVINLPLATVAEMRNIGVKNSKGDILIFLDADVNITKEWGENICKTIEQLNIKPFTITGSKCGFPPDLSWIEKYWFKPLLNGHVNYINSGHMITTRKLFNILNGFSSHLATGEDYDFSIRGKKIGAEINNNPSLAVIHYGYPKTILQFINREMWHGVGDMQSFNTLFSSKVALLSLTFTASHILLLFSLIYFNSIFISFIFTALIVSIPIISSFKKYAPYGIKYIAINSFIFYFYFISRTLSLFKPITKKQDRK